MLIAQADTIVRVTLQDIARMTDATQHARRVGYCASWDTMLHGCRQRAPRDTVPYGLPHSLGSRAVWDTMSYGQPCRVGYLIVLDFSLSQEGHDATKPKLNSLCSICTGRAVRVCAAGVHRSVVCASRCSSCDVPCWASCARTRSARCSHSCRSSARQRRAGLPSSVRAQQTG